MGESIKSRFKPSFPKKYKGDSDNIICRSSWERRFCNYCDLNENILQWGSEEFWIHINLLLIKEFIVTFQTLL